MVFLGVSSPPQQTSTAGMGPALGATPGRVCTCVNHTTRTQRPPRHAWCASAQGRAQVLPVMNCFSDSCVIQGPTFVAVRAASEPGKASIACRLSSWPRPTEAPAPALSCYHNAHELCRATHSLRTYTTYWEPSAWLWRVRVPVCLTCLFYCQALHPPLLLFNVSSSKPKSTRLSCGLVATTFVAMCDCRPHLHASPLHAPPRHV